MSRDGKAQDNGRDRDMLARGTLRHAQGDAHGAVACFREGLAKMSKGEERARYAAELANALQDADGDDDEDMAVAERSRADVVTARLLGEVMNVEGDFDGAERVLLDALAHATGDKEHAEELCRIHCALSTIYGQEGTSDRDKEHRHAKLAVERAVESVGSDHPLALAAVVHLSTVDLASDAAPLLAAFERGKAHVAERHWVSSFFRSVATCLMMRS